MRAVSGVHFFTVTSLVVCASFDGGLPVAGGGRCDKERSWLPASLPPRRVRPFRLRTVRPARVIPHPPRDFHPVTPGPSRHLGAPGRRPEQLRGCASRWLAGYDSSRTHSAWQMMSPVNWPPGDQRPG